MRSTYGRVVVHLTGLFGVLTFLAPPAQPLLDTQAFAASKTIPITVATASDAANGDASSVQSLRSNPGPDGISLREAILVTNNKPGRYAIRFARTLKGANIRVGSATGLDLPALEGGGVSVDGDIDGNGRPDVTVRGGFQRPYPSYCLQAQFLCAAFRITSSNNDLRNLNLRVFAIGVLFTPATDPIFGSPIETHRTYANNVVSGLVMSDIVWSGIGLSWHRCVPPCKSQNKWVDTRFVNNTIQAARYGISFQLSGSIGDRLERFTVEDNTIRISRSRSFERIGIGFEAGNGSRNRISDLTIAGNTLSGDLHRGIRLGSGVLGGDANTIERVRIIDNQVSRIAQVQRRDRDPEGSWCGGCFALDIMLGEGSALFDPTLRPVQYADRNHVGDVEIGGNTVGGPWRRGMTIQPGGNGSERNRVEGINIHNNTFRLNGLVEGIHIDGGDCYVPECPSWKTRPTRSIQVSDVSIDANDITIDGIGRSPDHDFMKGGIVLVGGMGKARNGEIEGVRITNNRIDTELIGISLLGASGAERNVIFDVRIEGNQIVRKPVPIRYVLSDVKGITVTGGFAGATGNQVSCVALAENVVAGVPNDVSVVQNTEVESDYVSSRNTASIDLLILEDAVAHAPNVFIGTVTGADPDGSHTVKVEETWRSEYLTRPAGFGLPETVEVRSSPRERPCPFMPTATRDRTFRIGERYLFVPYKRSEAVFWDDGWTQTTKFDPSLERFRPLRLPDLVNVTEATGRPPDATGGGVPVLGLGIAAAVGVALGLALLLRRVSRRRLKPNR